MTTGTRPNISTNDYKILELGLLKLYLYYSLNDIKITFFIEIQDVTNIFGTFQSNARTNIRRLARIP